MGPPGTRLGGGFRDDGAARRGAEAARERARIEAQRRQQDALEAQRRQRAVGDERLRQVHAANLQRMLETQRQADARRQANQRQRDQQQALNRLLHPTPPPPRPAGGLFNGLRRIFGRPAPHQPRPALSSEELDRRAEAVVGAQEADFTAALPGERAQAESNGERIDKIVPLLDDALLGPIPLHLILGWIDKESSGVVNHDEVAKHPGNAQIAALDEVGPFCISGAERTEILHLGPADRQRMMDEKKPLFAMRQGVRLARFYQRWLDRNYGVTVDSPAVWELVKLSHKVGYPTVGRLLHAMSASADPGNATWHDIKVYAARHGGAVSLAEMQRVDVALYRGSVHAARVQATR